MLFYTLFTNDDSPLPESIDPKFSDYFCRSILISQLCIVIQVGQLFNEQIALLKRFYDEAEAENLAYMIFEHIFNYRRIDVSLNRNEFVNNKDEASIRTILDEIETGKPIQYILGYCWFHDMKLAVNPDVLIPRRETEELVSYVIGEIKKRNDVKLVIDFCTGSGCIALAIKKSFPEIHVLAIDNSVAALDVARRNAVAEGLEIHFQKMNVLDIDLDLTPDIIISNPPYIRESLRSSLEPRVKNFEPHMALFVPDDDPLVFYRKISEWSMQHLKKSGKIYYEIGYDMNESISALHSRLGFQEIAVKRDLQEKDRMFSAVMK